MELKKKPGSIDQFPPRDREDQLVQGLCSREVTGVTEDAPNHSYLTAFLTHNEENKV